MEITVAGTRPTRRAPKEHFTGTVLQDPVIMAPAPARLNCSRVSFEPGARTNWHHHPLGQTLYVISAVQVPVHMVPRQVPEPEVPLSRPKPTARLMPVLKVTLMLPASATRPDAVTAALLDAI